MVPRGCQANSGNNLFIEYKYIFDAINLELTGPESSM
jgi:hypothetical protein